MEQQIIANGGLQYVPQIAVQYVYLDFDGELTSYNGEILTIDNVDVQASSLTEERIAYIVAELNAQYADQNVIFVSEKQENAEYSTIFIGKTEAFSPYGNFAGLAETIDFDNQNKTDKAFVMLDSTASNEAIISTISHETAHLLGTLNHGREGLAAYAYDYKYYISSGVTFTGKVLNYDYMYIYSGGTANSTTVNYYGEMYISSGGTANSTTINSGGYMYIYSGGTANYTTVNYDGYMYIESGGTANSTTVYRGYMYIESGGTANSTTVNSDGYMGIYSGGTAIAIKENGGYVDVTDGANVTFVSNTFAGVTLSYGSMTVHSNTVANSTTVNSSGYMYISSGGTANSTTVNSRGSMYISRGGTANSTTVYRGYMYIESGGTANRTTVYRGSMCISSGGTAIAIKENGGYVDVTDGANVTFVSNTFAGVALADGDKMTVHSNTVANSTTVNYYGEMYISSGGIANKTAINSAGYMYIESGGTANNTTVNSDGDMYIESGGIANRTTVNYDGYMYIYSGGTANSTTVNHGSMYIYSGGTANSTTVNSDGCMYISSGGTANSTTVNSDGYMYIYSGGTAIAIKENGGYVYVAAGANVTFVSNTFAGVTLSDGDAMTVHSNTVANSTTVDHGGMYIYSGGTANNTTVNSSGYMYISSGGTANSTTVYSSGYMYISSDAIHRGYLTIASGGIVSAYSGARIDFSIEDCSEKDTYLINNMSLISGTAKYTITAPVTIKNGVYKLAQGVNSFTTSAISIYCGSSIYGSVAANGSDFTYSGKTFSLDLSNKNLTLTVSGNFSGKIQNLKGNSSGVSWNAFAGVDSYHIEYSKDNFAHSFSVETDSNKLNTLALSAGTYQWRVKAADGEQISYGENIISQPVVTEPREFVSNADGNTDVFFANANGRWDLNYVAQHIGILNGWDGTNEQVTLYGKNKLADIFEGSTDANILIMTDDSNGDALFVDDIYTALPGTVAEQQARIAQIDEIRAGFGDDIVDLTSQRFAYAGNGVKVYGGLGNDTIWANNGSNTLFGDAGNDRIVGGSDDDVIIGGSGNDSLHGGGGDDTFCFGGNWGTDTVEQLSGGSVTLWFEDGSKSNWNASTLTYTDGANSVKVSGVSDVTLKFGEAAALPSGCFDDAASEKIFEDKNKGMLA